MCLLLSWEMPIREGGRGRGGSRVEQNRFQHARAVFPSHLTCEEREGCCPMEGGVAPLDVVTTKLSREGKDDGGRR